MTDKTETPAFLGLVAHGIFAAVEDASFEGSDGVVKRSKLLLHDPVGFSYLEIYGMGDDAVELSAQGKTYSIGDRCAVRVRTSKSGALMYERFVPAG